MNQSTATKRPSIIVAAALKLDDKIIHGVTHYDKLMTDMLELLGLGDKFGQKGFIDQYCNFIDVEKAYFIAAMEKQFIHGTANKSSPFGLDTADVWGDNKTRMVVCAANKFNDLVIPSARHFDIGMNRILDYLPDHAINDPENIMLEGFVDQWGEWMGRGEALEVATIANQINKRRSKTSPDYVLFSEDLY